MQFQKTGNWLELPLMWPHTLICWCWNWQVCLKYLANMRRWKIRKRKRARLLELLARKLSVEMSNILYAFECKNKHVGCISFIDGWWICPLGAKFHLHHWNVLIHRNHIISKSTVVLPSGHMLWCSVICKDKPGSGHWFCLLWRRLVASLGCVDGSSFFSFFWAKINPKVETWPGCLPLT